MSKLIPIKDEAALVLEDGSIYKIQHKRQRKVLSCVRCHNKKIKCDKQRPTCNNCLKNKMICSYFVNNRVCGAPHNEKTSSLAFSDSGTSSTSNNEFGSFDGETINDVRQSSLGSMHFHSGKHFSSEENQLEQNLKERSNSLPSAVEMSVGLPLNNRFNLNSLNSANNKNNPNTQEILAAIEEAKKFQEKEKQMIAFSKKNKRIYTKKNGESNGGLVKRLPKFENIKHGKNVSSKNSSSKSFSSSLSTSISSSVSLMSSKSRKSSLPKKKKLGENHTHEEGGGGDHDGAETDAEIFMHTAKLKASDSKKLLNDIPTEETSLLLYNRFMKSVHPVIPLLNVQGYPKNLSKFYSNLRHKKHVDYKFLITLLLINYTALRAEYYDNSVSGKNMILLEQMIDQHKDHIDELLEQNSLIPILTKFTVEVMINSVLENPNFTKIAELVRVSQKLKLEHDLAQLVQGTQLDSDGNSKHRRQIKERKLLMWQLFKLDTLTSLHNDLPPLIKTINIGLLDEIDEFGKFDPGMCFLNAKYKFITLMNDFCTHFKTGQGINSIKERIVELHSYCTNSRLNLSGHKQRLLEFSEASNEKENIGKKLNFVDWAIYNLQTFPDRALLLLHLNLIRMSMPVLGQRKNKKLVEFGQHFLSIQNILNDSGNLQLDGSSVYDYEDLTNNLIPSSLHYLDAFNKITDLFVNENWGSFNWELSTLPIDAITFTLKTLALDLNRHAANEQCYNLNNDVRFLLLRKCIPRVEMVLEIEQSNTTKKKHCVCLVCFHLVKLLFELIKIKFGLMRHYHDDESSCEFFFNKYDIEQQSIFNRGIISMSPLIPQPAPAPFVASEDHSHRNSSLSSDPVKITNNLTSSTTTPSTATNTPFANNAIYSEPQNPYNELNFSKELFSSSVQKTLDEQMQTKSPSINDSLNTPSSANAEYYETSNSVSPRPTSLQQQEQKQQQHSQASANSLSFPETIPLTSSFGQNIEVPCFSKNFKNQVDKTAPCYSKILPDDYYNEMDLETKTKKLNDIRTSVEKYITLLNEKSAHTNSFSHSSHAHSLSAVDTFAYDDYYIEFENAILEILSGILSMPIE
ncbi:hypothetical protein ACO0QE_004424 [Hanseniaspora vineae]